LTNSSRNCAPCPVRLRYHEAVQALLAKCRSRKPVSRFFELGSQHYTRNLIDKPLSTNSSHLLEVGKQFRAQSSGQNCWMRRRSETIVENFRLDFRYRAGNAVAASNTWNDGGHPCAVDPKKRCTGWSIRGNSPARVICTCIAALRYCVVYSPSRERAATSGFTTIRYSKTVHVPVASPARP